MLPQLKQADVRGPGTPYRVFVSYSRYDAALAKEFLKHLKASARTVGSPFKPEEIFFDQTEIMAGDEWERIIQPALDASHTVSS